MPKGKGGRRHQVKPETKTPLRLSTDVYVEILARLECLEDKLAVATLCQNALEASKDPQAWRTCNTIKATEQQGDHGKASLQQALEPITFAQSS